MGNRATTAKSILVTDDDSTTTTRTLTGQQDQLFEAESAALIYGKYQECCSLDPYSSSDCRKRGMLN